MATDYFKKKIDNGATVVTPLDIIDGAVSTSDIALIHDLGKENLQSITYPLFGIRQIAYLKAETLLRDLSYPVLMISLEVSRYGNGLQIGDFFKFSFAQYSISEKIFRIVNLTENDPTKDSIVIEAIESLDYITSVIPVDQEIQEREATFKIETLNPLQGIEFFESIWPLSGEVVKIIPIINRLSVLSTGYHIYYSIDNGVSYTFLENGTKYSDFGLLGENLYIDNPFQPDLEISIETYGSNRGEYLSYINESTTDEMFLDKNLMIIDNEIISFKKIEINTGDSNYTLTGVNRGLYNTEITEHSKESLVLFPNNNFEQFENSNFVSYANIKLKVVPFSPGKVGDLSEANEISFSFNGKATKPYTVHKLTANGDYGTTDWNDTEEDLVITWGCATKGSGTGVNRMDLSLNENIGEGYFTINAYYTDVSYYPVGGSTEDNTVTITRDDFLLYTGLVPDFFKIRVTPYIYSDSGVSIAGRYKEIEVNKAL